MPGTLPPTGLLVTHYDVVQGLCLSYLEVAALLEVTIDNSGNILCKGKKKKPVYVTKTRDPDNPNAWEPVDAIKDWCRYHLQPGPGYKIYRVLV